MGPDLLRRAMAELVATLVLVFAVVLAATSVVVGGDNAGTAAVAVALTHGLLFGAFLHVGLHANPAVTAGALVRGLVSAPVAAAAVAGQVVGAMGGAALARSAVAEALWKQADLGLPRLSSDLGTTSGQAVLVEALLVAAVVWVFLSAERPWVAAAVLAAGAMAAWQFTGGALNPARAFGPAVAGGGWDGQWVFWVGPVSGAALAGAVSGFLSGRERTEVVLD